MSIRFGKLYYTMFTVIEGFEHFIQAFAFYRKNGSIILKYNGQGTMQGYNSEVSIDPKS